MPDKLIRAIELLKMFWKGKATGWVRINFSQGGVTTTEKYEVQK